jgi:hypothetical protein
LVNSETQKAAVGEGGPVAMARTANGTVYLYEVGSDDLRAYAARDGFSAGERVRWLLARVASRGTSGPLSDEQLTAMGEPDIEALAEQLLDTPQMQQRVAAMVAHGAPTRAPSESAVAFLDRVLRRPEPVQPAAGPSATSTGRDPRWMLPWAIAALGMGCILSALAALFTYRGYEREVALETQVQRLRVQLEATTAQRDEQARSAMQALLAQNQELRTRIERLEARPTRSPDRTLERSTPAAKAAKPRSRTRR